MVWKSKQFSYNFLDLQISRTKSDKPRFDTGHLRVNIREDTPTGSIITTVNATVSDDSASPISYRFPLLIDNFSIDQFTGDITLIDTLHWHVTPTYNLIVEAFTSGPGTTLLVTVNVDDVNDHTPFIVSQPTVLLPSSYRKGGMVHRVVAIDLDKDPEIRYSLKYAGSEVAKEFFKIDEKSGEIFVVESSSALSTSFGGAGLPETLTIRATDLQDLTKFDEQKVLLKASNASRSTWHFFDEQHKDVTILSTSPQGSQILQLKFQEGVDLQLIPSSPHFELKSSKIVQKSASVATGTQRFTIVAQKDDELDYSTLKIHVEPVFTEPPKISSTSCGVVTIEENVGIEDFKRILATGMTEESRFRFQGNAPKFSINSTTGSISVLPLDREASQEHLLIIILTDGGSRNDSCTVRVTVADQNDNKPQLDASTPSELEIAESSRVGDVLHRFRASDMDIGQNGKFSFELLEDSSGSLDLVPETGDLVLRRLSSLQSWKIKLRVVDHGVPGLYVEKNLEISNRNPQTEAKAPLEFLKQTYLSTIDEGLPRGQFIAKLQPELAGLTYSIVEGNIDSAFSVDSEGVIRTNLELDREILERYSLKVIGTGSGQQIGTRVDVRVNNLNDNVPSFPMSKPRRVPENLRVGSYVATVGAKDVDNLAPLRYFLVSDSSGQTPTHFNIDQFTGTIHLTAPLDFEVLPEHTLTIKATDGSFDTFTNLTIFVSDINDNAPTFSKPLYQTTVSPATFSPGQPFAKIEAHDLDARGALTYSLGQGSSSIFRVAPESGALFMKVLPPAGERYLVTVTATDNGVPSFSTSVPVSVIIGEAEPTDKPGFEKAEFRWVYGN